MPSMIARAHDRRRGVPPRSAGPAIEDVAIATGGEEGPDRGKPSRGTKAGNCVITPMGGTARGRDVDDTGGRVGVKRGEDNDVRVKLSAGHVAGERLWIVLSPTDAQTGWPSERRMSWAGRGLGRCGRNSMSGRSANTGDESGATNRTRNVSGACRKGAVRAVSHAGPSPPMRARTDLREVVHGVRELDVQGLVEPRLGAWVGGCASCRASRRDALPSTSSTKHSDSM